MTGVEAVIELSSQGCTIPFIARYRKEMTGGLDEEQIRQILEQHAYQQKFEERKQAIIDKVGNIEGLDQCTKLSELEALYAPYVTKRKTKAMLAKEAGLEPVVKAWLKGRSVQTDQVELAEALFVHELSQKLQLKTRLQESLDKYGRVVVKLKSGDQFKHYDGFNRKFSQVLDHQLMAIDRGIRLKELSLGWEIDKQRHIDFWTRKVGKDHLVKQAIDQALSSIQKQRWKERLEQAHAASLDKFSLNLERLLSTPPLQAKTILGWDPAYRTGCKLAVVDGQGALLTTDVVYLHQPDQAKKKLGQLIQTYGVELIACGNGTASRESAAFIAENCEVPFILVSEAGASVYSASAIAREEFGFLPVEKRSAISIARRVLDPLSELVKIDPQSIGVGQYQHDLNQKQLSERLDFVVSKVVNRVGVDLNRASVTLLAKVSGLTPSLAKAIVSYRDKQGQFHSRQELLEVPRFGQKAFEQSAGFLRIKEGQNPLDNTTIHPESYEKAIQILKDNGYTLSDVGNDLNLKAGSGFTDVDIVQALEKPATDYRDQFPVPKLRHDVLQLKDLSYGMILDGTVRNVTGFGAFVDIGLKQDGLIPNRYGGSELAVNDIVSVKVLEVDEQRGHTTLQLC